MNHLDSNLILEREKMKIRKISPNNVVKLINIEEVKGSLYMNYLDESNVENRASCNVEISKNKYRNATLEDWNLFLGMLSETAVPTNKLQTLELDFGKEIDEKIKSITARFATEPQNIPTLAAELGDLTARKSEIIKEMIAEEVEKIKEQAIKRSLFHISGIQMFEKDGKQYRSIEIPNLTKKTRNIKTVSTKLPYFFLSFYKKKDNQPLKYSEVKSIDFRETKISAKISNLTDYEVFKNIFKINDNVLDKILKDGITLSEDGNNTSSLYRLIQVTSKNDEIGICKALKDFRDKYKKTDSSQKVAKKDIEELRKFYNILLKTILDNKKLPDDYNLYLNLQSNAVQRKALADKIYEDVASNVSVMIDGDFSNELKDVYFTNILATIKIPRVKETAGDVEPRTVWYIESSLGNTIEPPKPSGVRSQGYFSKQIESFLRNLNKNS